MVLHLHNARGSSSALLTPLMISLGIEIANHIVLGRYTTCYKHVLLVKHLTVIKTLHSKASFSSSVMSVSSSTYCFRVHDEQVGAVVVRLQ